MNGCIIPGTDIAVDFWKIRKEPTSNLTFFLTHLHGDHIVGLTSSWSHPIYCTEVTAQLLGKRHGLHPKYLRPLEVGECHMITTSVKMETISVTVIDANHCPGAAMFLFEGTFGKILHTGDFRYHPTMFCKPSPLFPHIETVDVLYMDNTFCSPECLFPSREEAREQMLDIIRQHPECDIIIGVRKLGKEELLVWLAEQLKEWISVSGDMFVLAEILKLPRVFRAQDSCCRIRTVPFQMICKRNMLKWNATKQTIAILPTSIYTGIGGQPYVNQENVFVVPYSDHSSYRELVEFVSKLKPASVVPIVHGDSKGPFNVSLKSRADMSVFGKYCQAQCNQRSARMREVHVNEMANVDLHHQARKPRLKKSRSNLRFKKSTQKGVEFESLELEVSDFTAGTTAPKNWAPASDERNETSNKHHDFKEVAKENLSPKNKKNGIGFMDSEGLYNKDEVPGSQGFEACHVMYLQHMKGRPKQSGYKQDMEEGPPIAHQGVRGIIYETNDNKKAYVHEENCIELQTPEPSSGCGDDVMDCFASEHDFDEAGREDCHDDIAFGNTYLTEKDLHAGLQRDADVVFQNDLHDGECKLLQNEGDSREDQGDLCNDDGDSQEHESSLCKDVGMDDSDKDRSGHHKRIHESDCDEAECDVISLLESSPDCKSADSGDASGEQSESQEDSTPRQEHPSSVSTYKDSDSSVLSVAGHPSSRNTSKTTSHSECTSSVSVKKRQRCVYRFKRKRFLSPSSDDEIRNRDEEVHEDQFKPVSSLTKRQRYNSSSDTDRTYSVDLQLSLSVKRVTGHPRDAAAQSKYNTVLCIEKWLDRHSSRADEQ